MKKIWKISLITLLVLLFLAAAAVTYTVATFKPNDLKPRVINYFQQKYQRKLVIPGDLGLSLYPVLHIESGQSSLMEKNGEEIFASIESAKVSLSWPALINNRFDVSEVTLDAPSIHIKRFSDGTMNIDDFLGKDGASLPIFDIKGLKIHRATWIFDDQNNHVQLSNANLQVGRLADSVPSEFSFDGDMRANHDEYNLHIALKSPLLFDLYKQNFSLDKMALSIKGKAKAADKTVENNVDLSATGSFMFDGEKKRSRFAAWNLQSRLTNGTEQWNAKVSFGEAVQEGKNWRAANVVSEAEQLTATYRLVSSLSLPEFGVVDARPSGKDLKLHAQWTALPGDKKAGAQPSADTLDAVLTIGELYYGGAIADGVRLRNVSLTANGQIDHAPVKIAATGNMDVINNNQFVTDEPLDIQFSYQPAGLALEGSVGLEVKPGTAPERFDVNALKFEINVTPTGVKKPMKLSGSGTMSTDWKRKIVSASVQGKLNDSKLGGKIGIGGFSPPLYTFDLSLNHFNTAWLESKAPAANVRKELPDLGWVKELNANGALRIGEIVSADRRANGVRIDVKSEKVNEVMQRDKP